VDPQSEPVVDHAGRLALRSCASVLVILLVVLLAMVCLAYGAYSLLVDLWP
jgi:hypothetical protein